MRILAWCKMAANTCLKTGQMGDADLRWEDYKMNVELHRSYLDLAIKLNMFYYGITGALLSFHFTNPGTALSKYALVLPILLSIGLSIFFFIAAFLAHNLRVHIRNTAKDLGLLMYPEGIVLVMLCLIFGVVLAIVSVSLLYYLACV